MTRRAGPDDVVLATVRALPIDASYIREVIETLTSIGSSPLGFRNTGTPEDAQVADFVSAEMRRFGLVDVAVEGVDVDAWRFRAATVLATTSDSTLTIDGCSLGGIPPTPSDGVTARLVDVGDPTRARLDRLDLAGAVVLADWKRVGPSTFVLELARRGVVGVVLNSPSGAGWFQSANALGSFDGHWPQSAPSAVMIRKEDAAQLRAITASRGVDVTMTLDVEVEHHATGHNIVGYLPGDLPGPIVVGAHHDAWFRGAFDNTSGVAAMLAIAKAMTETGQRPRHTICFTSRTAEEYGLTDSMHDWCIGAWRQLRDTHPEWGSTAPFHLCLEASGHPLLRTVVEAPVELAVWARRVCRAASKEGWTPTGWRVAPPVAGTEQWPYLISGVPGVAAYAWEMSFATTDYHTQLDTLEMIDTGVIAAQSRLYSLLLLAADRDPDSILDHRARVRQLAKIADDASHPPLAAAASRHRLASGRAAFAHVGRGLLALDAQSTTCYPHEQSLTDLTALDDAIVALDNAQPTAAARALTRVGAHRTHPYLSEPAFTAHTERLGPEAVARSWGAACHLTQSPNLWAELAALRAEPGARLLGPWVRASLARARTSTQRELDRRLTAMAHSLTAPPSKG